MAARKPPLRIIGPDLPRLWRALRADAAAWACGRHWPGRLLVLGYLLYAGWWRWGDREVTSWFSGITLLFHELGHVLFAPFGEFWMVAGGSLTQLLVPIVAFALLARQRDYFGLTVAACWLAMSVFDLARYVADAGEMALPLVGFGMGDRIHDWNWLLEETGRAGWEGLYASRLEHLAVAVWLIGCLWGGWLIVLMIRYRQPVED